MSQDWIHSWIKTECGRAKYADLVQRKGLIAKARLFWFIFWAVIKDIRVVNESHQDESLD